jgi:hypothetical protein
LYTNPVKKNRSTNFLKVVFPGCIVCFLYLSGNLRDFGPIAGHPSWRTAGPPAAEKPTDIN